VLQNIVVSVQYQVLPDKIEDSFYKLTSQVDQIRAYVFDVVRSTVPRMDLDNVFISKEVRAYVSCGFEVPATCTR
jgi:regulator of protease activity HflC (stomatin/prohibitin superfamily)